MVPIPKDIGDAELIDDFHPVACSLIGGVGSNVLYNEFERIFQSHIASDHLRAECIETNTDPTAYTPVGSEKTAWEPDVVKTYHVFGYNRPEEADVYPKERHEIHIPLAVQARLSDVPELEEIEAVPDEVIETMKIVSENQESMYPGIVTVCLDDLPGQFKIVDFTLL